MESNVVKEEVIDEKDVCSDVINIKQDSVNRESMRMSRRTFVRVTGATLGALALGGIGFPSRLLAQAAVQGVPLPGNKIPKFVDPLPDLHTIDATSITLTMEEFQSPVLPTGTFAPGIAPLTYVWRYKEAGQTATSHIGPVILARRGIPTQITYVNNLGSTPTNVPAWDTSTDQTLHWADPKMQMPLFTNYSGPIPAVVHLHGGEVPPELDGGPDAWFTSHEFYQGHSYYSFPAGPGNEATYRYPNTQEAANIWFHDHALGITRLNVYAGLAGAYIIDDPYAWPSTNAPKPPLIPLVIQDRMFDVNGQLFFPNLGINPEHPFWIPEFIGDTIIVNGKVWPFKAVDRQRYRFLFLNGSNARAYDMSLQDRVSGIRGPRMWVIGTDGGYLDTPVLIDPNATGKAGSKSLVVMPGERYEVIIDFNDATWLGLINAAYAAMGIPVPNPLNLELINTAKTPFPNGGPAPKSTTGRIMQFSVSAITPPDISYNPDPLTGGGQALRITPLKRLVNPVTGTFATGVTPIITRQLTLNEVMGPGGPLEVLVNNTKWDGLSVAKDVFPGDGTPGRRPDFLFENNGNYYSEIPTEGETELWEIINLTADAHPIHLHLVQFQLMNRQPFDIKGYNAAYNALFPGSSAIDPLTGAAFPPGVFIGGFGPPANYDTGVPFNGITTPVTNFKGGNPDVTPFINAKKGPVVPPLPHEAGWKDTVIMYPGQVTRIMVRWAPTDKAINAPAADLAFPFDPNGGHGYVWHCHIIDHEDNEMMRPTSVVKNPIATRTYNQGTDY
jgi:spore coat protein A